MDLGAQPKDVPAFTARSLCKHVEIKTCGNAAKVKSRDLQNHTVSEIFRPLFPKQSLFRNSEMHIV